MKTKEEVCVVLMTYGSPETLEGIPAYLKNVRGGRLPDDLLVGEFRRRYSLIGGSPLVRITQEQAAAVEIELNHREDGRNYKAVTGMRFSTPYIADVVAKSAPESGWVVGLIMSPQFSPTIMDGYITALKKAVSDLDRNGLTVRTSGDWHMQSLFLQALAERLEQALLGFPSEVRNNVQVLFTAHSMPKRVIEKEPGYVDALMETAHAVAEIAGLPKERWTFCYQSAGHTPEEWLKPDFTDVLPELRDSGSRHVLVVPVQFLADHLETLYDIDIAARHQAEVAGMTFTRVQSLNTSRLFIQSLADVVQEVLRPSRS